MEPKNITCVVCVQTDVNRGGSRSVQTDVGTSLTDTITVGGISCTSENISKGRQTSINGDQSYKNFFMCIGHYEIYDLATRAEVKYAFKRGHIFKSLLYSKN